MHGTSKSLAGLAFCDVPSSRNWGYKLTRNLALATLLLIGSAAMGAQTFTVTTTADDKTTPPAGSLRKAIADAADGDTIEFDAAVTGTITLGGAELLLDKDLTITGPGAAALAISGNQQSRVFQITSDKTVAISGLTIRDGKAADGTDSFSGISASGGAGENGGGIFNQGRLTLTACWLTNNLAGEGGYAGARSATGGPGGSGGAILNTGELRLMICRLNDNHAGVGGGSYASIGYSTGGAGGSGGGVHSSSGAIELLNCDLSENSAGNGGQAFGGGFDSFGGMGGDGGAVSVKGGTALFDGCSLARCRAGEGKQGTWGPGSGGSGGGIYIAATATLKTCTISGNAAGNVPSSKATAGDGGGVACLGGAVSLISCTISDNVAGENPGNLTTNPSVDGRGGGVYTNGGTVTIKNTIVAGNRNTFSTWFGPPYGDPINVPNSGDPNVFGGLVDEGHNLVGAAVNPKLAPLADYGGPTLTHALVAGSPAIDAGDDSITGTDQRGQPRLVGPHVDIGSFEGVVPNVISFAVESVEVDEAVGTATIAVQRTGDTASSASAVFSTLAGTATETDYTTVSGTLEFAPGQTQATIQIPIADDSAPESPETFQIRLTSSSTNTGIYPSEFQTVTILDNDGPGILSFATANSTIAEAGGNALITVQRKNGAVGSVSVNYATVPGSAQPGSGFGSDYTSVSGTLTFGPGITTQTFVVPILDDSQFEGDETFSLQLSEATGGATLGTRISHVVTIANDDPAPPPPPTPTFDFEVAASSVSESGGNILIKVIRSVNISGAVSVSYQTSAGTASASADFTPASGTLNFPNSSTQQTIVVPITSDDLVEGAETFTVTLSNPTSGAVLGTRTMHTVTIVDAEGPVTVEFSGTSSSVAEAAGNAVVTLVRTGNTASSVSVHVSAANGTATSGSDYVAEENIITFLPGVSEQTVSIPIVDDTIQEGDEEFSLVLSNPGGGSTLGSQSTHSITILADSGDLPELRKAGYRGLVESADLGNHDYGSIVLKTTAKGQLTGTLQIRGKTLRLRGGLSETGSFSQEFSKSSLGNLVGSSLQLQVGGNGVVLNGSFQVSGGPVFQVEAKREVEEGSAVAEVNAYTALLQTELPGNPAGFLRTRVLPSGKITLAGKLPDGTRLSASSHLTEDRSFPVFFPLYAKHLGCLAGDARFVSTDSLPLTGELHWQKPANSQPPYADGLTNEPIELFGNVYTPPHRQRLLDDFDGTLGTAFLQFSTAASPDPLAFNAMWNQDNTIRISPPQFRAPPSPIRVSLQPGTGLFTGKFRDAEDKPRKLFGICIQRSEAGEDLAVGFAAYGETSERVEITPQVPQVP